MQKISINVHKIQSTCVKIQKLTSFSLFYLECQIQSTDGKIDGLRIDGPNLTQ